MIDAYSLITPDHGWLLKDNRLYKTQTGGRSWADATPPDLAASRIRAVTFLNAQLGWLVLTNSAAEYQTGYALARTTDGGQTWGQHTLPLFSAGDARGLASAIYLQFLDPQTGWLVVKQISGSNFSLGTLFRTEDGGDTWTQLSIPIGAPVRFVTPSVGWTAGGPAGAELYQTQDGGQTWTRRAPTSLTSPQPQYLLPDFSDSQTGIFPVVTTVDDHTQVEFHVTRDGGVTWQKSAQVPVGPAGTSSVPLSVIDGEHWMVVDPETQHLTRVTAASPVAINPQFPAAAQLTSLDMASAEVGWALSTINRCSHAPEAASGATRRTEGQCVQEMQLLRTQDSGQDWTPLPLPPTDATTLTASTPFVVQSEPRPSIGGPGGPSVQGMGDSTQLLIGQGFDKCDIPTLAELQDWITNSPYRAVNLYIGGSLRGCANSALTGTYLSQLRQQGWTFIPTWVGPQVPCSPYRSKFSEDLATAYNQGVAEANAAVNVAANLGLTLADNSGTVIYYDLEAYAITAPECAASRGAAKSFISGWTSRLHTLGNQAGVYGGAYGSALADFAAIPPNVPDAVWLAAWYTVPAYRSDATVWLGPNSYFSDTLWTNHQRIRQYASDHSETWGTTSLTVDSNVIDGIVTFVYAPAVSTQIYLIYPNSPFRDFQVLVNGYDSQHPIAGYRLQQQMDSGPWVDVGTINTSVTRVAFDILSPDDNQHTFNFRAQAWDSAGYMSPYPVAGDSSHTVPALCPAAADSAEPDNTPGQARNLVIGAAAQSHNFHAQGDVDWVTMNLQADNSYMIATDELGPGRFADTVIALYDSPTATTPLAQNDDAPSNWPASRLFWKPTFTGTYYLKVWHFDTYGYGCYTAYSLSAIQARQSFLPMVRR